MAGRKFDLDSELDKAHREVLNVFPQDFLTMEDIAGTRAAFTGPPVELSDEIEVEDVMIQRILTVKKHHTSQL